VTISVSKATGADFAVLSAIIVQEYTPTSSTFLGPTNLRVADSKTNAISLHWQDRSDSETAYEVLRALPGGGYTTLTSSLAANTTSYTDATAEPDQVYYYMVRARKSTGIYSDHSNVARGYTYKTMVHVNFTNELLAPSPWNNTKTVPQDGTAWKNLKDLAGSPTSINLVQTGHFAGLYGDGLSTGNNSGVFPDNVLVESYGLFPGQSASIKLSGLHLGMKYDLTFFASSAYIGDVNVAYTVNGRTSLLNASLNKHGTLTMYDIEPDENGEVWIEIAPGTPFSQFGLIGALVIKGYSSVADPGAGSPFVARPEIVMEEKRVTTEKGTLFAYPNPFRDEFSVSVPSAGEKVDVVIVNAEGKIVFRKQYGSQGPGTNTIRVQPGYLKPGIYLARITYGTRNETQQVKLIRQ
jgi:hypothetical protein